MFAVHILGGLGVEAEFVVPSPVHALDLALRASRAGYDWRARRGGGNTEHEAAWLTIDVLRELADGHVGAEPAEAQHLLEVLEAERVAAAAGLN